MFIRKFNQRLALLPALSDFSSVFFAVSLFSACPLVVFTRPLSLTLFFYVLPVSQVISFTLTASCTIDVLVTFKSILPNQASLSQNLISIFPPGTFTRISRRDQLVTNWLYYLPPNLCSKPVPSLGYFFFNEGYHYPSSCSKHESQSQHRPSILSHPIGHQIKFYSISSTFYSYPPLLYLTITSTLT